MKKIGLSMLLVLALASCGPGKNAGEIAHTQGATLVMSNMGNLQTLILALLALFLVVPIVWAVFLFLRCLSMWKRIIPGSGGWLGGPNVFWDESDEPDLTQQVHLDPQGLFSQLFSQIQDQTDQTDPLTDW